MGTPKQMQFFRLSVKGCSYYDLVVEATDLETAIDIANERWLDGELKDSDRGFVAFVDDKDNELVELANW